MVTQTILLIAALFLSRYVNKSLRWYWYLVMGFGFYFLFFGVEHEIIYGFFMIIGGFIFLGFYKFMVGNDKEKKDRMSS